MLGDGDVDSPSLTAATSTWSVILSLSTLFAVLCQSPELYPLLRKYMLPSDAKEAGMSRGVIALSAGAQLWAFGWIPLSVKPPPVLSGPWNCLGVSFPLPG